MIGTIGTNVAENEAFLYLDRHFAEKGLDVPEVYAVSADHSAYLQQDLGDMSLFRMITRPEGADYPHVVGLIRETLSRLPDLQFKGAQGLDFSRCFPVESLNARSIMWDLNYFKYCFLKLSGIDFDEQGLENDFERLTMLLLDDDVASFMYRDFQSRNVMVSDGKPWFIDFQGGRRGPCLYDLASFLWQAKARFSPEERGKLALIYLESVRRYHYFSDDEFNYKLCLFALFRTLQVLGAYGLRGLHEQKPHFIESIPFAVENLQQLSHGLVADFPALAAAIDAVTSVEEYHIVNRDGLVVEVNSFGFRMSGIPRDLTGNGGGYVFDCRAIHNPGRYPEFMTMTGMDKPVIDFLEADGGVFKFLDSAKSMVRDSVKRYLERGFKNLKVSFGCTGGRHRSVYCAEAMARFLNDELGVAVDLHHREQGIHRFMAAPQQ